MTAARASLHHWEEPCISGVQGSGTVFFSGCTLRCSYCQNREIAAGREGWEITPNRLAEIFLDLQEKGAHNINLVTPTHFSSLIVDALAMAKDQGMNLPIVYNTSGYEKEEILRQLEPWIDIYLTDFKYGSAESARRYSRAENYPDVARRALQEMVRQKGEEIFDDQGMMRQGVIVRHLILPGHTREAMDVLSYLHKTFGDRIWISILNQYTPLPGIEEVAPEINRGLTAREYEKVVSAALSLGIEKAFLQEGETAKESFIPSFDGEGIRTRNAGF